jgi:hypothetical protein
MAVAVGGMGVAVGAVVGLGWGVAVGAGATPQAERSRKQAIRIWRMF